MSRPDPADTPPRSPPFQGPPGPLQRLVQDQRVLFLLVGGVNTAFSTALFVVLTLLFPRWPSTVIVSLSWLVAVLLFFFVYRQLVFRVRGHLWTQLLRFASVNLFGLLAHVVVLGLLVDFAGLPAIPVQVTTTVVIVVFNYLGHKHFSFRPGAGGRKPDA